MKNFAWHVDRPFDAEELLDAQDLPARVAELEGQFAFHLQHGSTHVFARDRLGVHKLFVAIDPAGQPVSSHCAIDLVRAGSPLSTVQSVPAGHVLQVDPSRRHWQLERHSELHFGMDSGPALVDLAGVIRARLAETFSQLAELLRGHRVFVALSGGLDSTTIAVLARRWFDDVTAVTFRLDSPHHPPSEDVEYAARVARVLELPFETVSSTPGEILELVDEALLSGQDWREFNVHCAAVNAALARAIRKIAPSEARPIAVLTGDVMNELMADYGSVHYRGRELYALPRLPPARLRRFLVAGLDAGDREVGVFARQGIAAIQPYAWCADAYAALPASVLGVAGAKAALVRAVMGDEVPAFVLERPKVRAQAGSTEPGGTLAVFVDAGIDERALARRFCALYDADERDLANFVRAGIYRFSTTYPT